MAYFSLNAYDADVRLPEFKGINQADISLNPDVRFAAEAENVETPLGVIQPQAAVKILTKEDTLPWGNGNRVETLAVLHRRWYSGEGSKTWYIAAAGGKLYQKQEGSALLWEEISTVGTFSSDLWSCVTYETNSQDGTVDVLLMSNAVDGMIMVTPPDRPSIIEDYDDYTISQLSTYTIQELASPSWTVQTVSTGSYKFGVIERFGERIWGGGIPDEPDLLVYSAPYDPTDWTQNNDIPEDGAGEVRQPSWDGDKFYALRRFGDRLLAFKKNRIWQVLGLNPGEYVFNEQFGEGTEFFNTVAVDAERVFMASSNGIVIYDGVSTTPYARQQIENIWRTVNKAALDQMCAALHKQKYYLAFPVGNSTVNNAMLVYNFEEGTILFYKDFYIETFLHSGDYLFGTSSQLPGRVIQIEYDSWVQGEARNAPTRWVSPWMDFGYKKIQKGGFDLYFIPEVQDTAVDLIFTIETEKKAKTKRYTVMPTDKEHRGKRLHFGGSGRKFRIIIETEGSSAPWRLIGGLQMVVETDPD